MRDQRPMSEGRDRGAGAGEARRSVRTARAAPRRRGVGDRARWPGRRATTTLSRSGETLAAPYGACVWQGCSRRKSASGRTTGFFIDRDGVIQETKDPYSFPPPPGELDIYLLRRRAASTIRVPPPCSPTGASSSAHIPREIWSRPERSGVPPNRSGESERRRPLPTDTGFSTGSSDARYREAG